jgi:hypothetical protein
MGDRRLPRKAPPPLTGGRLERHFAAIWGILSNQVQLSHGYAPVTVGAAREFFVRDFLSTHFPSSLRIGTGHIMSSEDTTGQIDVVVYHSTGLALPLGSSSLYFAEAVAASIEVKSTLTRKAFVQQIARGFGMLPSPQPLKVVFAVRLAGGNQYRRTVARWAFESGLDEGSLPDLVIVMDNAPIVRGSAVRCLQGTAVGGGDPKRLYKLGDYRTQKWLGLMLLVVELAQRASEADWGSYIREVVSRSMFEILPVEATAS